MKEHTFPWWAGYFLINPFRKMSMDPTGILGDHIKPGMRVLEPGCAMGFFTVPMAKMVGNDGKVYALDLQERMLSVTEKRLRKRGLLERTEIRKCPDSSLCIRDLKGQIDVAFVYAVMHEVRDRDNFIKEIYESLKNGGILVFGEPHVVDMEYMEEEVETIRSHGFFEDEDFSIDDRFRAFKKV